MGPDPPLSPHRRPTPRVAAEEPWRTPSLSRRVRTALSASRPSRNDRRALLRRGRRGERWAWLAIAVFALGGILTAALDEFAWGGWYTFRFPGLLPTAGVIVAAPTVRRRSAA
jgi:hypothetical protein